MDRKPLNTFSARAPASGPMDKKPLKTFSGYTDDTYYEIVGKHETYSKPNGAAEHVLIEYYLHGSISFGGEPPSPASFLSFPVHKARFANQLWRCSMRAQQSKKGLTCAPESNVLLPRLRTYNKELKRILIGYEAFDGFLTLEDQNGFASSGKVPGNPNQRVQELIRSLILALKSLHRKGVSSSLLHHPCAFVWVAGTLKIWLLDICVEDRDWTEDERAMLARHICQLGFMIRTHLLEPALYSHAEFNIQRRYFVQCFWADFGSKTDELLNMLATHHFLDNDMLHIFLQLAEVHHAIKTRDCNFNVNLFLQQIQETDFLDSVMPTGNWIPDNRIPRITNFLQKDAAEGYEFAFAGHLGRELYRFSRHLYHHYGDKEVKLTLGVAFRVILSSWPSLLSKTHEMICKLAKP